MNVKQKGRASFAVVYLPKSPAARSTQLLLLLFGRHHSSVTAPSLRLKQSSEMIRRSPTLIQMSDLDVQDIRDMAAEHREEALRLQQEQVEAKRKGEDSTTDKMDTSLLEKHKTAEAKQQERNRRLGLDPGKLLLIVIHGNCLSHSRFLFQYLISIP
jgi:hypothetical protein